MGYGFNRRSGGIKQAQTLLSFNGNRPITKPNIPGLSGHVLGGKTITEFLEGFFPSEPPLAYLSGGTTREFGDSAAIILNWTAVKRTAPIGFIDVAGQQVLPTGNTQSGSRAVEGMPNVNTSWYLTVRSTTNEVASAGTTLAWTSRRRVGRIAKDGINQLLTDADIRNNAAIVNELSYGRGMTLNGLNGNGNHLFFEWPIRFGLPPLSAGKPVFKVNGLPNNGFTLIRNNQPFTNGFGYTEPVYVIISDSPLTGVINLTVE
jgi:hypothetical protein